MPPSVLDTYGFADVYIQVIHIPVTVKIYTGITCHQHVMASVEISSILPCTTLSETGIMTMAVFGL